MSDTSTPVGHYAMVVLVGALWASALVSALFRWPVNSSGDSLSKRYDISAGVEGAVQGVMVGCVVMDAVFM